MGTIPSETIEQIAAANDIVEVIGSIFRSNARERISRRFARFIRRKRHHFHVSPQRQTFHCFGCGVGGSVFRFVMDYEHVDFPQPYANSRPRRHPGDRRNGGQSTKIDNMKPATSVAAAWEAAAWFHENLTKREFAEPARKYLKERGITAEIAKRWQLGYAPEEWDAFGSWARGRGYNARDLIASGLVQNQGRCRWDAWSHIIRSLSWANYVSDLQRHRRSDSVQRSPSER
jgi:DNA primase